MLLCKTCNDSKWSVSREADGVHLFCHSFRLIKLAEEESGRGVFASFNSSGDEFALVRCGYTILLPHYTSVVPTARP